jgi:hypothetical protein
MFFKENKNFLSKENIDFIENKIFKKGIFPWYLQSQTTPKNTPNIYDNFFAHIVLERLENKHITEVVNSSFYNETVNILTNFLNSVKIKLNFFTRISYNLTYNNGIEKCGTHADHDYNHNQIIIYLNDCLDKNSKTIILGDNKKIIKEIKPEQYKGVCFGSNLHYHFFPKEGARIVLVATFI